jgi:hypothetical protein
MKRLVSLPALVAHAAHASASTTFAPDDPRAIRAPFFTTGFVLSLLLWPLGVLMGSIYCFHSKWRSAGVAMITLGLIAGLVSMLVYWSLR